MFHINYSRFLNAASILSLSACLLGSMGASPVLAMLEESSAASGITAKHQVFTIKAFAELDQQNPGASLPSPQPGDVICINVGHGLVQSVTRITDRNTDESLFESCQKFAALVQEQSEEDYEAITKQTKLSSGDELVKLREKGLPDLLDKLSAKGVYVIPITSRSDDRDPGVLYNRTEKEFNALGYKWMAWAKPPALTFENPEVVITLQDDKPEAHGTYKFRNGTIYTRTNAVDNGHPDPKKKILPHKSAAIVGLVNELKAAGQLPGAIYFSDGLSTIEETVADLKETDLGVQLNLLEYVQPKAFETSEEVEEFYIHRLGAKFNQYQELFKTTFSSVR